MRQPSAENGTSWRCRKIRSYLIIVLALSILTLLPGIIASSLRVVRILVMSAHVIATALSEDPKLLPISLMHNCWRIPARLQLLRRNRDI